MIINNYPIYQQTGVIPQLFFKTRHINKNTVDSLLSESRFSIPLSPTQEEYEIYDMFTNDIMKKTHDQLIDFFSDRMVCIDDKFKRVDEALMWGTLSDTPMIIKYKSKIGSDMFYAVIGKSRIMTHRTFMTFVSSKIFNIKITPHMLKCLYEEAENYGFLPRIYKELKEKDHENVVMYRIWGQQINLEIENNFDDFLLDLHKESDKSSKLFDIMDIKNAQFQEVF